MRTSRRDFNGPLTAVAEGPREDGTHSRAADMAGQADKSLAPDDGAISGGGGGSDAGGGAPLYTPTTYRILLVDDSAMNRKLLGKWLKSLGHRCDEVWVCVMVDSYRGFDVYVLWVGCVCYGWGVCIYR